MSLRPAELAQVVTELNAQLAGAVVQKVWSAAPGVCHLEVRQPGRSVILCFSSLPGRARLSVSKSRPRASTSPTPAQNMLRQRLVGARILTLTQEGSAVRLSFLRGEKEGSLSFEVSARGNAHESEPSRLPPTSEPFGYAEAAEALFAEKEHRASIDARRRAVLTPLKTKLARMLRTLEKVKEEASRGPLAEAHRGIGELLSRNLAQVPKGARAFDLIHYDETGPVKVHVALSPSRTPKQEVVWRFHQYRRLSRGAALAGARLLELSREAETLKQRILELEASPDDAFSQEGEAQPPRKQKLQGEASPYRAYAASGGAQVWVGKGARQNDALTFRLARPHHLWVHVRGVPGAHVVVPMAKGAVLAQELLLDAAHLALYHSNAKGERQGEVSYTMVKFVRRVKGGAPGQVTYTHEKTFWLRVEEERLARLLASVVA